MSASILMTVAAAVAAPAPASAPSALNKDRMNVRVLPLLPTSY